MALQKDIQSNLIGSWISKSTSGVWTTIQFKNEYFERKILVFENGWHVALKEIGTYEINGRNIIPTITSVIADGEVKDPINDGSSYSFWKVNGKWILFFKGKDSGYNSEDSVSSCSEKNGCYIKGHL